MSDANLDPEGEQKLVLRVEVFFYGHKRQAQRITLRIEDILKLRFPNIKVEPIDYETLEETSPQGTAQREGDTENSAPEMSEPGAGIAMSVYVEGGEAHTQG